MLPARAQAVLASSIGGRCSPSTYRALVFPSCLFTATFSIDTDFSALMTYRLDILGCASLSVLPHRLLFTAWLLFILLVLISARSILSRFAPDIHAAYDTPPSARFSFLTSRLQLGSDFGYL